MAVSKDRAGKPPADAPPEGDFALDVGDDLLAEALAAVEARFAGRPADAAEMAAFEADLDVLDVDPEAGGDDAILVGEPDDPGPDDPGPDETPLDFTTLAGEWKRLERELDAARLQVQGLEQALEEERRLRRCAEATARGLRDRAERAEERAEFAREARQANEEQVRRLRDALARKELDFRQVQERRQRDQTEHRRHGQAPALLELLPVLDNLELALSHADSDPERVVNGIRMVAGQFHTALERLGVERVKSTPGTPFQPEVHEAFIEVGTEQWPPGTVVEELSPGYRLRSRLLRAARVSVARAPQPREPEPSEPDSGPAWCDPEEVPFQEAGTTCAGEE